MAETRARPARRIVIVGGGFAGAVTAAKLLNGAREEPLDLYLVEPRSALGRGLAYGTEDRDHLVNGPARLFSLRPEDPDHLPRWLAAHGQDAGWSPDDGAPLAESFPPRGLYGRYVGDELARAAADARERGAASFAHLRDRALDVLPPSRDGTLTVMLGSGRRLAADQVVLATGLVPAADRVPADPALAEDGRHVADPWVRGAFRRAPDARAVVFLGANLTMLDALIGLEKAGFRGHYLALSRRGLLVQHRRNAAPWRDFLAEGPLPRTAVALLRAVRTQRRAVSATGEDWQRLPPAIRQHLAALWAGAGEAERRRFARHLRPYWDVALHRAAPGSFRWLEAAQRAGRFAQRAGRVEALAAAPEGRVALRFRPRGPGAEPATLTADIVVNCLGGEFDWRRIDRPLERNLLARGLVRPHATGFGIDADQHSFAVVGADGRVSERLFAVGHPLRGVSWESSSIPEQLAQAVSLAATLAVLTAEERRVA